MVLGYLSTDTLLCWAPSRTLHDAESKIETSSTSPPARSLREVHMSTAMPIISYLTTHVWPGVELNPILEEDSIMPTPQPTATTEVVRSWIQALPAFELAALERAVLATKSLTVATRLLVDWSEEFVGLRERAAQPEKFGIEEAARACSLETTWQTDVWGEVEDTHDVQKEDLRRQLGSAILLVQGTASQSS
jgi:ATP synthase F1 complex assembly factor 2